MSTEPPGSTEFNFWEFACCSKCHLPFTSGAGTTVPFWLTECGHVVCNNHLNSDQSCARCGAQGIELVPLQRDMEPPMSDWFRSVPSILDSAVFAVRFQQESMAAQIRNFKNIHQQQRAYIQKLKKENAQLKQTNEMLTIEINGMQNHSPQGYEPAAFFNVNGKRRMIDVSNPPTSSSPRSVVTPVGPDRITLPPGQQPPELSSNENILTRPSDRPGSSRFAQRFSYSPVPEKPMRPPQLSHAQAAPKQFGRPLRPDQAHNTSQSQMLPPPAPAKLKYSPSNNFYSNMPPPQPSRNRGISDPSMKTSLSQHPTNQQSGTNNFLPLNGRVPPPSPSMNSNSMRFLPPVATRGGFRPATSSNGSGQRMAFVPRQ